MDGKYQEIDETKSYHREINMLRKKTNFTWGKMMTTGTVRVFTPGTQTRVISGNKKGIIKSFPHLTAMSELQKIQAIVHQ